jgi:hypothetical protein
VDIKRQIYYHVRHAYKQIQRVKTWQLLIVLVLSGFVTATFLRLNNIGMAQRRESVLQADKEGRDEDMSNRMYDLQRYVSSHMNASTGQFDLTEQYKRDDEKARNAAMNDKNPNGNIFAQAETLCRQRFPDYMAGTYLQYQQCFIEEIDKYPPAPNPVDNYNPPAKELYRHSFASPRWSPDFAGFSLLFTLAVAIIILGRWLHYGLLALLLKLRQKGIGG